MYFNNFTQTCIAGGIFESKYSDEALMFKYAINKANKDMPPGYSLSFDIQEISDDDSFSVAKIGIQIN